MTIIKILLFTIASFYLLDKYGYTGCCNKIKINWVSVAILLPILSIIAYIISLL